MDPEVKTPPSRHYFYRKATQQLSPSVLIDGLESSNAFENRINDFIKKNALQTSMVKLRQDATNDLNRRKADRKARKEKEENKLLDTIVVTPPPLNEQPLFEKPSNLNVYEQNAWLANIHDDAMLMNPHQWLKLASLFNVNSRASRQQSLLNISYLDNVLQDRNIDKDGVRPLETYMELRDIQNRNYARDSVAEGVKFIKQNRYKEAMEYYKRALDMDPKYAEGWFHVAEGLVHQRKLTEAENHLDRVLKLDPSHEGAKALLASIRQTTKPKKVEKGDEWDIVDERGQSINTVNIDEKEQLKETLKKRREQDERRKKRSDRSSRRRSRSPTTKSSRRDSRSPRKSDETRSSRRNSKSPTKRSSKRDRSKDSHKSSKRDDSKSSRRSKSPRRSTKRDEDSSSKRDDDSSSKRDDDRSSRRDRDDDKSKRRDRRDDDKSSRYRHRSSSRSRRDDRKSSRRDDDRKSSRRDEEKSNRRDDDDNRKSSSRRDGDDRKRRDDDDNKRKSSRRTDDDKKSSSRRSDDKRSSRRTDDKRTRDKTREKVDTPLEKVNPIIENMDIDSVQEKKRGEPMDIDQKDTTSNDKVNGTKSQDANGDNLIPSADNNS